MKRPLQNILAVGGSDAVSRLLGFATSAYLARVLGTSAFGIMSIGFSVLSYAAMLSSPGVTVMGVRDVAAGKDQLPAYPSNVNSLRCVLAVGCVVCTFLAAWLFIRPLLSATTIIGFSLSAIPLAFSLDWYFLGKENLLVSSGSKVVIAFVYLLFVALLVHSDVDVVWTAAAFFIANSAATLWLLHLFRRAGGRLSMTWNVSQLRELFRKSLPLGLSSFLTQTIMNLPVLIVGAVISSHAAGLFNAAMKLIFFAMMIDRVFYAMFFPVISRKRAVDAMQFNRTATLAMKIVLAVAVPAAAGGIVFASDIVRFVYGTGFGVAAVPFQILLLYFLFSVVNTVMMCVMIADNREREYLRIMGIGTAVLVALCVYLSFSSGLAGAAAAVATGEGLITVLLLAKVANNVFSHFLKDITPSLVAGGVMAVVLLLLNSISMFAAIPFGIAAFSAVLVLLKGISREEISLLRERFV